jgi:LysR family transcriptional regulator, transcriptional activator of nhaA
MISSINYNHLYYFWVVANEGGINKAASVLHLTPQTISAQISSLESRLGRPLFEKQGRKLKLTSFGVITKSYADEMFLTAQEWMNMTSSGESDISTMCRVGITDGLPKSLVSKWLSPVLTLGKEIKLDCQDGKLDDLQDDLFSHTLDMILTDLPMHPDYKDLASCQMIGKSSVGIFAPEENADQLKDEFPHSLNGQPMVMPGSNSILSMHLEQWLRENEIKPKVSVYANDIALMKTLGRDGFGLFAAPLLVEEEVTDKFHVKLIGVVEGVIQDYYLITPKRTIVHPIVTEIIKQAQHLKDEHISGPN